jgi:putative ABC transport system ATP-binding protein
MIAPLLEARAVSRLFNAGDGSQLAAVREATLVIEPGEMVAVVGPSGCGKSTLLHMLGGLDRPSSGELWLRGERVDRLSETQWAKRRRREIGFVFQFFNLIEDLSAADNVELPALIAGVSSSEARVRRRMLLERLGVAGRASFLPSRLSGGDRQRIAVARALVNRPSLLLADEPTGSLDSAATDDVLALLRELHAGGQTTVLVTHDPRVAASAGRVVHMRDGCIAEPVPADHRASENGLRPLPIGRS